MSLTPEEIANLPFETLSQDEAQPFIDSFVPGIPPRGRSASNYYRGVLPGIPGAPVLVEPPPVTGMIEAPADFMKELLQSVLTTVTGPKDVKSIFIPDWKNHVVTTGDRYRMVFDVASPLQQILQGSLTVTSLVGSWINSYRWNPRGLVFEIINRVLATSTQIGVLKDKIRFVPDQCYFTPQYKQLVLTIDVVTNPWQLYAVVAAILAISTWLTVVEVRKVLVPDDPRPLESLSDISQWLGLAALGLGFMFILSRTKTEL